MRFIDWFAGIGGFRRGMELAGHECIGFCEWDKFATASYTSMHLLTEKQREYLSTLSLKQRQKEILKEEYRNGEWYANDIRSVCARDIPKSECWCFGAPCQSFSVAGKREGMDGESGLIREIFRLLDELKEEDKPEWLVYENVKGMFSSNGGWDYAAILSEMEQGGYDIEWQNINSAWFVPQNRERIYTIGHLRRFGRRKILPIERTDGENSVCQIGNYLPTKTRDNPNQGRIYDSEGISPCLNTCGGGNLQPRIEIKIIGTTNPNRHSSSDILDTDGITKTLLHRDYREPKQIGIRIIGEVNFSQDGQIHSADGIAKCHSAGHNNSPKVAIPVIDVGHISKSQNGKRMKENGEPMFTLTAQDRHGVGLEVLGGIYTNVSPEYQKGIYVQMPEGFIVYAVWYEKEQCYITVRKLTPKECFRLQGWTDDYFEKAAFVNSDSQLYKQAGNGVTVPVVKAIGESIKKKEGKQDD